MADYQLFSDVTADLSDSMMVGLPRVEMIPMPVQIGGKEYLYGPGGNLSVAEFYRQQRAGSFATTAQIPPEAYLEIFEPWLKEGRDILYLCFSSGLSGTWESAELAARQLRRRYPERRLFCVDTLCASVGEGFLVREAARKKAEGLSMEELAEWVKSRRLSVCHWFTVDGFTHLRHGGRVSAAAAAVGSVLNIKPLLHVDEAGRLAVVEKPRGARQAMKAQIEKIEAGWKREISPLVVIGHGDSPESARQLSERVSDRFAEAEIHIADIGPVIGSHTGPGMLALIYWGENR